MTSEPGDVTSMMTINAVPDMAMFSKMLAKATVMVKQPQKTELGRRDRRQPETLTWLYAASGTVDRRIADATYLMDMHRQT